MVERSRSDVDGGLEELMSNPEIAAIVELVKKNHVVTQIMLDYDHDSVTQAFPEAWMVAEAFAGRLKEIPREYVEDDLGRLKKMWADAIEREGITDEDLLKSLQMVWVYARLTNPTVRRLEEAISFIEGTEDTAVFASGLAAIDAMIAQFTSPAGLVKMQKGNPGEKGYERGEFHEHSEVPAKKKEGWMFVDRVKPSKIVVIGSIYGGTFAQLEDTMHLTGKEVVYMPISQFIEEGLPDDTDFVHCETSNNPPLRVIPLEKVVAEAKRVGELRGKRVLTSFDNTFTPLTVRPAMHGVDFVVHSCTKYFGGHSKHLGGSLSGKAEDVVKARVGLKHGRRMVYGANMDRAVARDFLEGMRDLPERLYKATRNAKGVKAIAERFDLMVRHVESDMEEYGGRYKRIRNKNIPQSISNGMINIDFGSVENAREFIDEMVKEGVGKSAVSLGCVKTYYSIPAETTHSEMPREEQDRVGITPGMVRISCGIEPDLAEKFEKVLTRLFPERVDVA